MAFDRAYDVPGLVPVLRLIAESSEKAAHFLRRPSDWTFEQSLDPVLQASIGWQPDRMPHTLDLEKLVNFVLLTSHPANAGLHRCTDDRWGISLIRAI